MKKSLLILGILAMVMAPAILPAAEEAEVDLLAGAVEFGEHTAHSQLIWKSGRIEDIDETGIRVADLGYGFTENTRFYNPSGQQVTRLNFHKGALVKFVLKRDPVTYELVEIVKLIRQ